MAAQASVITSENRSAVHVFVVHSFVERINKMEDKRFAHIGKDPKFRPIPRKERKVKVDSRFNAMFQDNRFKLKYSVDKRGRPVNFTTSEQLEKFYDIQSEGSEEEKNEEIKERRKKTPKKQQQVKSTVGGFKVTKIGEEEEEDEKESGPETSDTELPTDVKTRLQNLSIDYARGEGDLFTDSSSEESESEEGEEDDVYHDWGELDKDAESTDSPSRRIAVCNMDWDRIRAVDLFLVLQSFAPQGGRVEKVTIYPSDFGLERMKNEEIQGPKELVENSGDASETEEDPSNHTEKLRQYQLNRLKYYYAVVECDSVETASKIYDECDGQEFESSAARLDLRFIPDDMTFENAPRDICDALPDVSQYEPRLFLTSALQQAQVHLTWDETDPERLAKMQKLFQNKKGKRLANIDDADIKAYVAISSEDESESEEPKKELDIASDEGDVTESDRISKYKSLLAEISKSEAADKKKDADMEMEISWDVGLQDKAEKLVQKKLSEKSAQTVWEQQLAKRREKRKALKQQKKVHEDLQIGVSSDDDEEDEERQEDDDDIPSDIDMNDPYFREEFENGDFRKAAARPKKSKAVAADAEDPERAAQLELLLMDEDDDKRHFNMKKIIKEQETKGKKSKKAKAPEEKAITDDFQMRLEDPRFSALFTSHHYNVDPSDPNFKKTPGMEAILSEKLKRRNVDPHPGEPAAKKNPTHQDPELSRLVRTVKAKASIQRKN